MIEEESWYFHSPILHQVDSQMNVHPLLSVVPFPLSQLDRIVDIDVAGTSFVLYPPLEFGGKKYFVASVNWFALPRWWIKVLLRTSLVSSLVA